MTSTHCVWGLISGSLLKWSYYDQEQGSARHVADLDIPGGRVGGHVETLYQLAQHVSGRVKVIDGRIREPWGYSKVAGSKKEKKKGRLRYLVDRSQGSSSVSLLLESSRSFAAQLTSRHELPLAMVMILRQSGE